MRLQTDRQEWYRSVYLQSDHWKELRKKKLAKNPACEECGSNSHPDVHHLRYLNLFNVTMDDLKTLCRKCHDLEHHKLDQLKQEAKSRKFAPIKKDRYFVAMCEYEVGIGKSPRQAILKLFTKVTYDPGFLFAVVSCPPSVRFVFKQHRLVSNDGQEPELLFFGPRSDPQVQELLLQSHKPIPARWTP